jgi:Transposase and inactivated derivatives
MCSVFQVTRSGYYEWVKRKESHRSKRRKQLEQQIRRIFIDSRRLYGSPKVWQVLKQQGVHVSQKTVARIMKELGLKSRTVKKKYKATTNSKHDLPVADNVLNQQFSAQKPNEVWMADITYTRQMKAGSI